MNLETNKAIKDNIRLSIRLMEEYQEMKELLTTFKSMFEEGNNDLYLGMVNNLKTEI